jgi:hypothetical protein
MALIARSPRCRDSVLNVRLFGRARWARRPARFEVARIRRLIARLSFAKASSLSSLALELLLVLQHACAAAAELRRCQLGRARPRIRALREGERNESGVQRRRLRNITLERWHHRRLRDGAARPDGRPDRAARRSGIHWDRAGIWILRYAHWGGHISPIPVVLSHGGPFDRSQCDQGGGGQGNCCSWRHASYMRAAGRPANTK